MHHCSVVPNLTKRVDSKASPARALMRMRRRGIEWENITLNFCIVKEQKKGNARKCSTGKQKDWGVSKQGIKQEDK